MQQQKLKIAFNIDHFLPQRGGAERYLFDLVRFLLKEGHQIHIFAMDGEEIIPKNTRNFVFHKVPHIKFTRWMKSLSFVVMSSYMIKKEKFDIVQVLGKNLTMDVFQPHGGSHRASFRQNVLAFSENPLIRAIYAFFRVMDPKTLLFYIIEWCQFHAGKYPEILCISKLVMNDLRRYYHVPDKRMHLIYNGVDGEKFSLETRREWRDISRRELNVVNEKVILFIGHNFKLKGLKYFIESLAIIRKSNPDIKLKAFILGKGKAEKYLDLINNLNLKDICVFTTADRIEKYYCAADLLIQPTFYDPCSLVVLEALSCGVPVITTSFNGAGELIEKGITGDVVSDPRDISEIAASSQHFLKKTDIEKIAFLANQSVNQYNNETVHKRLLKFYFDYIENKLEK